MGNIVLVIEDNMDNMLLISDILEANGYKVIQAETGIQGVAMAEENLPDFIKVIPYEYKRVLEEEKLEALKRKIEEVVTDVENQAGESLADQEAGKDSILVAATAVRKVSEPERASGIDCESLDSESPDCGENNTESQPSDDFHQAGMDEESNKPLPH